MLSIDLSQAQRFIELLHGSVDKPVCFQSFFDAKVGVDTLGKAESFHARLEDSVDYFNQVQNLNYGVYVSLNKTDGVGREEHNIVGYRAIFADIDGMELPKLPLQPHVITQRDSTHSHCLWFVKGIVTVDQFKRYQKQVAIYLGSDEQVVDPSRVLRVAGTYNLKDPTNPAMYKIVKDYTQLVGRDHTYSLEEINKAFKLHGDDLARLDKWCDSRNSLDTGEGFNDNPVYRDQFKNFLSRCEAAVKGNGRSLCVIKVASYAYDKGIPLPECQEMMWEHYNDRIEPSYTEQERVTKLNKYCKRAYKYANNVAGCRTCTAEFETLAPPVIEPPCGWAANAKLATKKREVISLDAVDNPEDVTFKEYAEMDDEQVKIQLGSLIAQTKSNGAILDMARIFLMGNYPNGNLIRTQKVFYAYNGKFWQPISDDGVKSNIMFYFSKSPFDTWKLAPSKINNIYATIEQMVHYEDLQFDTWIDGEKHSGATNIHTNCITELVNGDLIVKKHTNKFFSLVGLNYPYIKDAQLTHFLNFLNGIWPNDHKLIMALQELMGYMLTSDTVFQKMGLFVGKSRGGKGVITNAITQMIGVPNTVAPAIETLTDNSVKEAMIKSKLIIIPEATEVSPNKQMATLGILKAASSGDQMQYHQMYKGGASGFITAKMLLVANTMPKFIDESGALANRFIAFGFNKTFVGKEDLGLSARIATEKSALFNWSMEGLKRLLANGKFTQAESAIEMVEDMKHDMFPLADFCDECTELNDGAEISSNNLYKLYQYFCSKYEVPHMGHVKFTKHLKSSYLPVTHGRMIDEKGKQVRGFKGITINAEYLNKLNVTKNTGGNVVNIKGENHLIKDVVN